MMRAAAMRCVLTILATACTAAPGPMPPEPDNPALPSAENDTCGAGMFANRVGKPLDEPGVPGESRLNRHIRQGTHVTMDYIAQRMNIEADAQGIIQRINCG